MMMRFFYEIQYDESFRRAVVRGSTLVGIGFASGVAMVFCLFYLLIQAASMVFGWIHSLVL